MSRHRTMRARCDSAMQEDDGDYFGKSVEDQAFSPGASSYLYQRGEQRGNQIGNYMPRLDHQNDDFDEEPEARPRHDSDEQQPIEETQRAELLKATLNDGEKEQLGICLDKMCDVLGDATYSDAALTEAAIESNFDANAAVQRVIDAANARASGVNNNMKKDSTIPSFLADSNIPRTPSMPLFCGASNSAQRAVPRQQLDSNRLRTDNTSTPQLLSLADPSPARPITPTMRTSKKTEPPSTVEKRVSNLQISRTDSPSRPSFKLGSSSRTDSPSVTSHSAQAAATSVFPAANDRPQLNLVVVGHVDAGKSTLMGHLLHRLNVVTSKEMRKNEQEAKKAGKSSFSFAWALDQNAEERKRGITMDIAQTRFSTANKDVTLLDAPGHKDFIPNMIVGAAQADAAILVVNATRGEFESGFDAGGQTREHAVLVRSCGIQQLIVAINQLDKVDYDRARFDEIRISLSTFLRTQVGYRDEDVRYVPVSGFAGENLAAGPVDARLSAWYTGPSLVDAIDSIRPLERAIAKPFRLFVVDAFKPPSGAGLCVSGTVVSGRCTIGDRMTLLPVAKPVNVKSIAKELSSITPAGEQVTGGTSPLPVGFCAVDAAFAGDSVTITLNGIEPNANERSAGWVLCEPSRPIRVTQRVRAQIVVLQTDALVTRGMPIEVHVHSVCESASIAKLLELLNRASGKVLQKRPKVLERGQTGLVELAFERPVCVELFSDYKELGRVMLRHRGDTIAAGIIVDIAKLKPTSNNE